MPGISSAIVGEEAEHAAQAEAANRLTRQVSTEALDHTNAMLAAEAQRANDAELAATTLATKLIALEAELAGASHAAAQQAAAEHERTKLTERLLAVEAELSASKKHRPMTPPLSPASSRPTASPRPSPTS